MQKETKLSLKWNKKDNDWQVNYMDHAGKSLCGVLFDLLKTTGHRMDWKQDLKTMLADRGYDYKTLKITINKIKPCNKENT